jgi:hypothetical protein
MGSIAFQLPTQLPAAAEGLLRRAFFAKDYDQAPVPTPIAIENNQLIANWTLSESRYFQLPWPVGQNRVLVTSTATLRETSAPYRLLTELARGKLNQVRTQSAEWQSIGLRLPSQFEEALTATTRLFGRALHAPTTDDADALAQRVIEESFALGDTLVRTFIEQMFATRHYEEGLLNTRLGPRMTRAAGKVLGTPGRYFPAVQIAFNWRDLEPEEGHYDWTTSDAAVAAARAAGQLITGGPVIDLAAGMLPGWTNNWEGDLPTLAAFMCDFLETVITRYRGDIRRWIVCAGFNHADALGLDDDDRLRLAFRLFEAASQIDPELDLVISVAQPWGDYLTNEDHTISPLTFSDDLIRAGLRVSAVELEFRPGTQPRGSLPRDLLETARVINLFGLLGLQVELVLSCPSNTGLDPQASPNESIWKPFADQNASPESQAEWAAGVAALGLCTPLVRSVTWDHASDTAPHLTPFGGLLDGSEQPKPVLDHLLALRTEHLR